MGPKELLPTVLGISTMLQCPRPDHVIHRLAEQGQTDPELLRLMKIFAAGEASTEELVAFDDYLDAAKVQDDS